MADSNTIALQKDFIIGAAAQMQKLTSEWNNANPVKEHVLSRSVGNSTDKLSQFAYQEGLVADEMFELIRNSAEYFKRVCKSFEEADELEAQIMYFG